MKGGNGRTSIAQLLASLRHGNDPATDVFPGVGDDALAAMAEQLRAALAAVVREAARRGK